MWDIRPPSPETNVIPYFVWSWCPGADGMDGLTWR